MSRRQSIPFAVVIVSVAILFAGTAAAQCGHPANCTFPNNIVVCPSGDIPVVGQVLDINGNPCAGSIVHMQFNPPAAGTLYSAPSMPFPLLISTTNANGMVSFNPWVGGCSIAGSVSYFDAAGVQLGITMTITSPDISGDGTVNLTDVSLFAAAFFGPYSPCSDFNMDGVMNLVDLGYLAQHLGH